MTCPKCGGTIRPGRHGVHDTGDCAQPWYRSAPARQPRVRQPGRTKMHYDLTPEQIERIMARRAAEQRWERNRDA